MAVNVNEILVIRDHIDHAQGGRKRRHILSVRALK